MPDITSPDAAPGQKSHGHAGTWSAACVLLLFAALIVFPGFIEGLEIRLLGWDGFFEKKSAPLRTANAVFFYPATQLGKQFPAYHNFCKWQMLSIAPPLPRNASIW